ncbi:monofunctional biosynthetic peptidoglycan transglycosylase [Sphingomonas sp.]|uniref:monofunctional biosynthetic peptidoglycan transglycosylase n=1 Tax=Sphingomonas sp. TaxID=28214 RepID=UPI003CC673D8
MAEKPVQFWQDGAQRPVDGTPSALPRRPPWSRRLTGWFVKALAGFVLLSVLWVALYRFVPPPVTFTQLGDMAAGNGARREWMSLDRMDPDMARAAIAGEDARFCDHHGFDWRGIAGAAVHNARGGHLRGGSTISQQTAKNTFLFQGGGYLRKGLEAYFTVLIEALWGKKRIMEVYLNVAETGIGTYGANAGAQRYFGHDASHLTPVEAGRIAAVLPLPKKRAAIAPHGFVRRHGDRLARYTGVVRRSGLDACLR